MEANGNGHVLRSQPNDRKHSGPFNMIIDDARTRDRKRFVLSKNVETGSLYPWGESCRGRSPLEIEQENVEICLQKITAQCTVA